MAARSERSANHNPGAAIDESDRIGISNATHIVVWRRHHVVVVVERSDAAEQRVAGPAYLIIGVIAEKACNPVLVGWIE